MSRSEKFRNVEQLVLEIEQEARDGGNSELYETKLPSDLEKLKSATDWENFDMVEKTQLIELFSRAETVIQTMAEQSQGQNSS